MLYLQKKYLLYAEKELAGITHTKGTVARFLKTSKALNCKPILPSIKLATQHSKKLNCKFENYIEIPDWVLLDVPLVAKKNIIKWNLSSKISNLTTFDKLYCLPWKKSFIEDAKNIITQMKAPVCCVHARRSDYLKIRPSLIKNTSPSHIFNVLNKLKNYFNSVYLMTSEPDPNFFLPLKKKFDLKVCHDFPELKTDDNYKLYATECCIRDFSSIRVSTFNTTKVCSIFLPNGDPNYFIDYLDPTYGYQ